MFPEILNRLEKCMSAQVLKLANVGGSMTQSSVEADINSSADFLEALRLYAQEKKLSFLEGTENLRGRPYYLLHNGGQVAVVHISTDEQQIDIRIVSDTNPASQTFKGTTEAESAFMFVCTSVERNIPKPAVPQARQGRLVPLRHER
ncbi:MAG: hypothetical protein SFW62_03545 [Alphaproteobacteria bacterium]|nr:hypothetical protein [Alphaproteobacteria bacterium]